MPMDLDDALAWAVSAFHDKPNSDYHLLRRYINGDHPLQFMIDKMEEVYGKKFRAHPYNLCQSIVEAHSDRQEVEGFGADDDAIAEAAQLVWDMNNMDYREGQVEDEKFGMGDAYVIVDRAPDGSPVIWPQLATQVRVLYSDELPGKRIAAARLWAEPGGPWRLNVYTEDKIAKYVADRAKGDSAIPQDANKFEQYDDGAAWPLENPVPGTVPVFHFGHNARVNEYGVSVLANVTALQNSLNLAHGNLNLAQELALFIQRVLIGVNVDDRETQDAVQQFAAGMSRILTLSATDGQTPSIAEFNATNVEQFTTVIEQFEKMVSHVTKVPGHALGIRNADFTSGAQMRMAESPFVSKMERSIRADGAVWSEVQDYCLRLMGLAPKPGAIRVNWKPIAPISEEERIAIVEQKVRAGWAFESALREAGYEPDQIAEMLEERARERDANRQLFDMGALPEA